LAGRVASLAKSLTCYPRLPFVKVILGYWQGLYHVVCLEVWRLTKPLGKNSVQKETGDEDRVESLLMANSGGIVVDADIKEYADR
jgi:hypothetical protein